MNVVSAKGTGGFWIFTKVRLNKKTLTALVDTGSTSILIDEKHTKDLKVKSIDNIAGLGGEFKSKSVSINLSCNNITKRVEAISFDFSHIHQMCDGCKVQRYDLIIGVKQLIQFNLSAKLYGVLRNK